MQHMNTDTHVFLCTYLGASARSHFGSSRFLLCTLLSFSCSRLSFVSQSTVAAKPSFPSSRRSGQQLFKPIKVNFQYEQTLIHLKVIFAVVIACGTMECEGDSSQGTKRPKVEVPPRDALVTSKKLDELLQGFNIDFGKSIEDVVQSHLDRAVLQIKCVVTETEQRLDLQHKELMLFCRKRLKQFILKKSRNRFSNKSKRCSEPSQLQKRRQQVLLALIPFPLQYADG
jgi:hypothetical protein